MRKLIFTTAFLTITIFGFLFAMISSLYFYRTNLSEKDAKAQKVIYAALPTINEAFSAEIITNDGRTEAIRQFFAKYGSPLEPYAQDVVDAADEYGLDYRLLPSIAMQESNVCRKIPENSNNCWGYGIYGGKIKRFNNYKEGIYTVSKSLGTKYKIKGLVTPDQIEGVYTPPSTGSWANGVNYFMEVLQ